VLADGTSSTSRRGHVNGVIIGTASRQSSHRRYIYISILAIDPTYFINAYGQTPQPKISGAAVGAGAG